MTTNIIHLVEVSRRIKAAMPTAAQAVENLRRLGQMKEITYFDGDIVPSPNIYGARFYAQLPSRHCIRETFSEGPAPGCVSSPWLKVWTFHYSDGTTEQLKRIIEK